MDLSRLIASSRKALEAALAYVREQPLTAASRAHQIQALTLLRTIDEWSRRTPYPEQPPRLAKLARDLAVEVLGADHASVGELRASLGEERPARPVTARTLAVCLACRRAEETGPKCERCGGALTPFDRADVVDGRFLRLAEIGRGAMGVVYEALDVFLERPAALKFVGGPATDAALAGFRREAAALASIRNDHVVAVYTFGVEHGTQYMAMERVIGRDLDQILAEHAQHKSALPVPLAVSILSRVASGVAAVHDAGVLHRDIKPANIVIEERTGRPVLVDFGLALRRPSSVELGDSKETPGTPLYVAPELVSASDVLAPAYWRASDIYALGCTAFEILTGRPPFVAEKVEDVLRMRVTDVAPKASSLRPGLSAFDEVLARALARDPAARHATALELARDLESAREKWMTPEPTQPSAASPPVRITTPPPVVLAQADGYPEAVRVLIVDDDDVFRRLASRCAELAFYQCPVRIEGAASSEAAIGCARTAMPDLVVLDYNMPGEDGIGTLTRLRALPGGHRARVVVVSASVSKVEEWRFRGLGVTDFVGKPVRFHAFVELIAEIASRAGWQNAFISRSTTAGA